MKISVYRAASREKRMTPAKRTRLFMASMVVPNRTENRLRRIMERMPEPPPDPNDLRVIPAPTPMMIPARIALSILSWTGTNRCIHCSAPLKSNIPAML